MNLRKEKNISKFSKKILRFLFLLLYCLLHIGVYLFTETFILTVVTGSGVPSADCRCFNLTSAVISAKQDPGWRPTLTEHKEAERLLMAQCVCVCVCVFSLQSWDHLTSSSGFLKAVCSRSSAFSVGVQFYFEAMFNNSAMFDTRPQNTDTPQHSTELTLNSL